MPLAFRQWHLYRFDFMVPLTGLEPVLNRFRRILSPLCLPFHHSGEYCGIIVSSFFRHVK